MLLGQVRLSSTSSGGSRLRLPGIGSAWQGRFCRKSWVLFLKDWLEAMQGELLSRWPKKSCLFVRGPSPHKISLCFGLRIRHGLRIRTRDPAISNRLVLLDGPRTTVTMVIGPLQMADNKWVQCNRVYDPYIWMNHNVCMFCVVGPLPSIYQWQMKVNADTRNVKKILVVILGKGTTQCMYLYLGTCLKYFFVLTWRNDGLKTPTNLYSQYRYFAIWMFIFSSICLSMYLPF